jgi:thiol-disulfide isomerase/thioredoxin
MSHEQHPLVEKVIVDNTDKFDETVEKYVKNPQFKAVLVYITGAVDASTGKSWCPDCVVAEPMINNMFDQIEQDFEEKNDGASVDHPLIAFIKCPVIREPYKKSDFPYRTHKNIHVKSIPTLILWSSDTNYRQRIVESQFRDGSKMMKFIEDINKKLHC